jgi:YidC/Oxa1 family membrane protein insertase
MKIMGIILNFFNSFTGNYLLALLLIALAVKIILIPLGIKQQKSMQKQASLKPKEIAIRNKYKGRTDQPTMQKMNQELQQLYTSEGYSPLSGCLPMVIQLPILFILYNTIINPLQHMIGYSKETITGITTYLKEIGTAIQGRGDIELIAGIEKNFDGVINYLTANNISTEHVSLETLPNFDMFGIDNFLADIPTFTSWLILVPILNLLVAFGSQIITKKFTYQPMQQQQQGMGMKIMMYILPFVTFFVALRVPAAIGIYWLFTSLLGTLQTLILYKAMPLPKCTEEDIKAAEKELKQSNKSYYSSGNARGVYNEKSAYLEDDDDEDMPMPGDEDDDGDDDMPSANYTAPSKPKTTNSKKHK